MEAGLLTRGRASTRDTVGAVVPAAALVAVTAVAALLRFWSLGRVAGNPFYDAAVRSMGQSWHDFFYGAVEPSGQVSIDKVPIDLWLQVAAVKLLGFTTVATRLPGALAGVLAVPLLYDLVRRVFGRPAGLAAAAALALLPISVLTARSDTMDSLMMLLDVLAAWLVVWGAQRRVTWPLVAAGAVMGLAFEVKLFEGLLVAPALVFLAVLAGGAPWRRRAFGMAGGVAAFVAVGLAWLVAASRAPLGARPWPIGSTNGSVWNVVLYFNGLDRLRVPASPAGLKLDPPGPLRLLAGGGHDYLHLVGTTLLAALAFGALALAVAARTRGGGRVAVALAVFLAVWLATGVALFSHMQRPQPRYLEAFTPAVAAVFGVAAGSLAAGARRAHWPGLALALAAAVTASAATALAHPPGWAAAVALGAAAAAVVAALARRPGPLAVCAVVAALAVPAASALSVAGSTRSDAGLAAPLPPSTVRALSAFLVARQQRAGYEVASSTVFKVDPLIVRDGRPVLMLTSYQSRPLLTAAQLARIVAAGKVRYVMMGRAPCPKRPAPGTLSCVPVVQWARAHSVDVSASLGLPHGTLSRFVAHPRRS